MLLPPPPPIQEMEAREDEECNTELGSLADVIDVDAASSSAPPIYILQEELGFEIGD